MRRTLASRFAVRGSRFALSLLLFVWSRTVSAHGLAAEAAHRWTWEPWTIALLLLSAALYATGTRRIWRKAGAGGGVHAWQAAAFAGGLLSIAIALLSPVAWLSEILFSVHMTQHEILMLISAPLLVFGQPLGPFFSTLLTNASTTDLWGSVVKCTMFGAIIAVVACYKGMTASGGAEGVGRAVNQAVVITFILIFFANFVMTTLYFALVPQKF